jgi:hypothetical protein
MGGYPPEFRRKVLDLLEAGRKVTDVARISESATKRSTTGGDRTELIEDWTRGCRRFSIKNCWPPTVLVQQRLRAGKANLVRDGEESHGKLWLSSSSAPFEAT